VLFFGKMPHITLTTPIQAPAERCLDLSRSIDLHMISTRHTGEQAIGGKTSGLIGPGESVRWRARHFGIWQTLTSKITEYNRPRYFVDEMVTGAFASFRHEHLFLENEGSTQMVDVFVYQAPLGVLGKIADALFLKAYMRNLLKERNRVIKEYAESDRWQGVL
jgi:ligand-binding SRPBCC domain-containing protein